MVNVLHMQGQDILPELIVPIQMQADGHSSQV